VYSVLIDAWKFASNLSACFLKEVSVVQVVRMLNCGTIAEVLENINNVHSERDVKTKLCCIKYHSIITYAHVVKIP